MRPKIPYSLDGGAEAAGPVSTLQSHRSEGGPRLTASLRYPALLTTARRDLMYKDGLQPIVSS
jgi:hypothetical protein